MDFKVIHIDETDSTNQWLRNNPALSGNKGRLLEEDAQEGCIVVVAAYQTAGKGCGTNSWESERGMNLTFSMLIHPEGILANEQFRITEIVSVAMCETLERCGCKEVSIKWPNDIYVGDRKICGILIENRLQGMTIKDSIIGIGLNVNQSVFKSDAPNPVSLYQILGKESNLEDILKTFLTAFEAAYQNKGTCLAYRTLLYRKGVEARYIEIADRSMDKSAEPFTAKLTDVLPDGRLLLVDQEGRERLYAFKEVQFII
jgi:BirA family biotin operon repressor/biotin-[acetyl-CoA-carboxylase] ligase